MKTISTLTCSDEDRVLIVDGVLSVEERRLLRTVETEESHLRVVDAKDLWEKVEKKLRQEVSMPRSAPFEGKPDTLFILVGEGGKRVKKFSAVHRGYREIEVFAKRLWEPGKDPIHLVGQVYTHQTVYPEIEVIIAIDDVISSGETLKKVFQRSAWKFPRAKWYAVALVGRGRKVGGYKEVFVSLVVTNGKAPSKKVPINTLGALVENKEMARNYAFRNLENPDRFLEFLEQIRWGYRITF